MIKTSDGLRQSSGDYRKYFLTFVSITFGNVRVIFGNLEGFGSSSGIVESLCTLRKSSGKPKLTKHALCLNQSEFSNFALYVIRSYGSLYTRSQVTTGF